MFYPNSTFLEFDIEKCNNKTTCKSDEEIEEFFRITNFYYTTKETLVEAKKYIEDYNSSQDYFPLSSGMLTPLYS